ncbi:MAG: PLP-dependent aminotransferase family protein [Mesorhizobium sp.]|uniref:MocR-like pyridoxine biosynthesis transcription factor PdxR n=1 Tax=Mesorhizobium sp. TaxID=1871066 RepID=UPI000FE361B8|nr:PLP-dependent aminotransferase family protein [Mesorhizobium sp.]RWA71004.1 MAG: PLP-dependent aminotransferase family protein [Mesorhizobium sp.]RWB99333.1 MAG: PLP-dependent aminotransferase family protein [Mesorhizobium sp.]RWK08138.1 MAG: PLP-dependent aminotransferase family protein [Mesorhizobium sp.]RWK17887.1 MAG: PLP-dependent aminotransferase family protein [Mesorhizobium sp.]RWK27689.1 MAG: PLP-dependent aminotransferase family protein [Mesorhizobium sp.]
MVQFGQDGIARSIIAAIKAQIHSGAYRPGDRLPSSRAFAAEWGASRTTVTAAYNQLNAEGYLIIRQGARAIVAPGLERASGEVPIPTASPRNLSALARRLLAMPSPPEAQPARVADFRYGDLSGADFPVLAWRRASNKAILRRGARLRYGDPQGSLALRNALQTYLWRARGISCTPDQTVIVNGSQQGLDLCARLLLDPGDAFVIENPGYPLARNVFAAAGGIAAPVAVDADGLRTDLLPQAHLACVTPSHQFPLGGVLSATRRRSLLAWATATGAYIIEDDYDGEYRHDIAPIPPLQTLDAESVIYAGTFSKTLSPTLRLGYLVVPTSLRRAFCEAKRLTDRHAPTLEQDVLADLLASGAYERHVRSIRRKNAERRQVLLQALADHLGSRVTVAGADTGLHVVAWMNGITAEREPEIIAAARAAGIGLYPVSPLYDPGEPQPGNAGFILGYAGLDTEALRRGVAVLATVLAKHR